MNINDLSSAMLDHLARSLALSTFVHWQWWQNDHETSSYNAYITNKDLNEITANRLGISPRYVAWMKKWAELYDSEYIPS